MSPENQSPEDEAAQAEFYAKIDSYGISRTTQEGLPKTVGELGAEMARHEVQQMRDQTKFEDDVKNRRHLRLVKNPEETDQP